ncbi:hypothetical protein FRC02_002256 [Tulasnella sp. 418]|nr:hypothetical protein FRC02_002256 [Tulasnella sp. 418]
MSEPANTQPSPTPAPQRRFDISHYIHKVSTRDGWLGDYDFGWLCTPVLPFMKTKKSRLPPFYAIDAQLPLLLAIVCGLQHALAMLAGLITPPYVP